ncbi:MAG: GNAT family N-acetyltransferase [Alphaproteobacteria bacterium]|nr:GNAT family N-acetyltransferase [Alphaproteobacteria bacterium]
MIELISYQKSYQTTWDRIITDADNSHFMFYRDYMEYHSDRFDDASYLVMENEKLLAVIAGTIQDGNWYSHAGLTFGGLVLDGRKSRIDNYINIYQALWQKLSALNIDYATIKPVPFIYHRNPCEADLYALGQANIAAHYMEVTTSISLNQPKYNVSTLRLRGKKKAIKHNITIHESSDNQIFWQAFWKIIQERLNDKYHAKPTHDLDEIIKLQKLFPDNIKLYVAIDEQSNMLAGTVLFITDMVCHTQYIAASDAGLQLGALDLLIFDVIEQAKKQQNRFFDFGISTEQKGDLLNDKLAFFKEGFGGRSVMHHTIKIKL